MATLDSASSEDGRMMPPEVAEAILPATLLGYVAPAALIGLVPLTATGVSRSLLNVQSCVIYAFISAPVTVPVLTRLISRVRSYFQPKVEPSNHMDKATTGAAKSSQGRHRLIVLRSLRLAYAVPFAIQAAQHLYTITRSVMRMPGGQRSLTAAVGSLLTNPASPGQKYSSIALYAGATLGFGLYTVWELRRRGIASNTDTSRAAAGVLAGQVLFGPGATYAGLWWWREGVLAKSASSPPA